MRVLLIGDSMAEGLERPLRSALAARGVALLDDWHRGDTTGDWTRIAGASIRNHAPDVLLVALGTNDAHNRVSPAQTARNAASIVQQAQGRSVLWLLPPNSSRVNANATNEAIKSIGVSYVDARNLGLLFYDGIHPTPASFTAWANVIASNISGARAPVANAQPSIQTPLVLPSWNLPNLLSPVMPAASASAAAASARPEPKEDNGIQYALVALIGFLFLRKIFF